VFTLCDGGNNNNGKGLKMLDLLTNPLLKQYLVISATRWDFYQCAILRTDGTFLNNRSLFVKILIFYLVSTMELGISYQIQNSDVNNV
jgi:hypothetical protein